MTEMSVLDGFKDLKPKDVLVWNANGTVIVDMGQRVELFQLQISPTGCLTARPVAKKPADQIPERQLSSREQRLAMTDQGQAILAQERGA
jgi:hypothetical protein